MICTSVFKLICHITRLAVMSRFQEHQLYAAMAAAVDVGTVCAEKSCRLQLPWVLCLADRVHKVGHMQRLFGAIQTSVLWCMSYNVHPGGRRCYS